jgi:hypothetical protein
MSTRITLRLAGLTAAIVVVLALVPAAQAKPTGIAGFTPPQVAAPAPVAATGPADWPGAVGAPPAASVSTPVAATGPADSPGAVGAPPLVAVSTPVVTGSDTGFNWTDATLGAVAAFGLSLLAAIAATGMRTRRGGAALRI